MSSFSLASGIRFESQENAITSLLIKKATTLTIRVGTILIKERPGIPRIIGLETEPGLGEWSIVKVQDAFALDREIKAAGWSFFFMAVEINAMFLGYLETANLESALKRILSKVRTFPLASRRMWDIYSQRIFRRDFHA